MNDCTSQKMSSLKTVTDQNLARTVSLDLLQRPLLTGRRVRRQSLGRSAGVSWQKRVRPSLSNPPSLPRPLSLPPALSSSPSNTPTQQQPATALWMSSSHIRGRKIPDCWYKLFNTTGRLSYQKGKLHRWGAQRCKAVGRT